MRDGLTARRPPTPDARFQVSNLTRHTVLATSLELADSGSRRNKGLLGRQGLAPGEGLWIVPCEAVHTFGMKFPIDLVYLDRGKRVKKLRNSVPGGCRPVFPRIPCSSFPRAPSATHRQSPETRLNSHPRL
jgi:uncharacterized membrane protein (UPF0127 family)